MRICRKLCSVILTLAAALILFMALQSEAAVTEVITFLTWKPNQPEVWEELIDDFHSRNPDIRVKTQVGPHSSTEYHAIVTQRLKNRDTSVDVFFMDVIWPAEFASAGWALDLSSFFDIHERKVFLKGPIDANTYKGGIYGVPCYVASGLLFYRRDLLEKYCLKPPETWDEMLAQGRKILAGENDPGIRIYSGQFKQYEGLVCNMLEFVWSNGGEILNSASGHVNLTDNKVVDAVAFVRDRIIGSAAPLGVINYEEPESLDIFLQGKVIFHRNWPYAWAVSNNPQRSALSGKVGVGPLPAFKGNRTASTLGGWQFGISRWSNKKESAITFVRFMTSYDSQKKLALEAGLAPARQDVYRDDEVRQKMPHLADFLPAFQNARPRPVSPVYPMISQELQRFFSRGIVDPEADIHELAIRSAGSIKRFLRLGEALEP